MAAAQIDPRLLESLKTAGMPTKLSAISSRRDSGRTRLASQCDTMKA